MSNGRHTANGLAGRYPYLFRGGAANALGANRLRKHDGVDSVRSTGHDENWRVIRGEHQRISNRTNLASQKCGRRNCGGRRLVQYPNLSGEASERQGLLDTVD